MAELEVLADGCILVKLGSLSGTVSSYHLVEPKLAQLRAAQEAAERARQGALWHAGA